MFVVIFFGLLGILFVWSTVSLCVSFYKEVWLRRTQFYDNQRCREIISGYTGNRDEATLRALVDGTLKPSDIKRYYNEGSSGSTRIDQEYRLITQINDREYDIKTFSSGTPQYSRLYKVELDIIDGHGTIINHWVSA